MPCQFFFDSGLTLGFAAKVPDVNDLNIPAVYYRELRGLDGHPARFLPVNFTRARQMNVLRTDLYIPLSICICVLQILQLSMDGIYPRGCSFSRFLFQFKCFDALFSTSRLQATFRNCVL